MRDWDGWTEIVPAINGWCDCWERIARHMATPLDLSFLRRLANRLTRPVETANQSEIDDETVNFAKIASGVEPPMMEDGQNYALRRQTLLDIGQKNPEAFRALTPQSWAILEARLKHFDGMLEQQKNAVIGRTMAAPALPEVAPAAPAAA